MAAPTITSVTAFQGTGPTGPRPYIPTAPVIVLDVAFTQDTGSTNFVVELSVDGGTTWFPCLTWTGYTGQNLAAGTRQIMVSIRETFDETNNVSNGLTPVDITTAKVRVRGTSIASGNTSANTVSANFSLKSTKPVLTSAIMAQYVGNPAQASSVNVPFTFTASGTATFYRVNKSITSLLPTTTGNYVGYSTTGSFSMANSTADGFQTIWVQIYDNFYNASDAITIRWTTSNAVAEQRPWWQNTLPLNCVVNLVGSMGNSDYTGIKIRDDGTFLPDREVAVQVYGKSPIPLYWKIIGANSDVEHSPNATSTINAAGTALPDLRGNVNVAGPLGYGQLYDPTNPDTAITRVRLTKNKTTPQASDYGVDAKAEIKVIFTDAAGNAVSLTTTPFIRLNTTVYKVQNAPLRPVDSKYAPVVREINSSGVEVPIDRSILLPDVIRTWQDIFHPISHSYPTTVDGSLDESSIYAPYYYAPWGRNATVFDSEFGTFSRQRQIDQGYDTVKMEYINYLGQNQWRIVRDQDGRPQTETWTSNGTKNYGNFESSTMSTLKYWVIDNSGYGDYNVEFEYFNLDSGIFGPPYNPLAPYKGDCLVIYDATDPDALETFVDQTGRQQWRLKNDPGTGLSKCVELFAYTGRGQNVINLKTGLSVGSAAQGDFSTPLIVSTSKIVIVMYSDTSHTDSGFKIKQSLAKQKLWYNYDIDEKNGEVWIHKHESIGTARGAVDSTLAKLLSYDYLDNEVSIDLDNGEVTFNTAPAGTVLADYSYYESALTTHNVFLATWDDFVDYQEATVYVGRGFGDWGNPDQKFNTTVISSDYEEDGYGRVIQAAQWNKDKGLLTFDPGKLPGAYQRLFGSYFHHTLKRIQSDGYGDLTFYHPTLVADITPKYPDYTWVDVKIINEGDALLEQARIKFTFRGYDKDGNGQPTFADDGAMDAVWDINRPWDIQKGTKDETYEKMGICVMNYFLWDRILLRPPQGTGYSPPQGNTDPNKNSQNMTALGIVGSHRNETIALFEPRTTKYGRVAWALGGSGGTGYPSTTSAGGKRCSVEVAGQYYSDNTY